jgi:hypothetical protein
MPNTTPQTKHVCLCVYDMCVDCGGVDKEYEKEKSRVKLALKNPHPGIKIHRR